MSISTRSLYWTAGFLEGDGSFLFSKARNVTVSAAQVQRWPLDKLQGMFGGSISIHHYPDRPTWQSVHRWVLTGTKAAGLMMTLFSLMTVYRKEQIKKALEGWKTKEIPHQYVTHCPQGHAYTPENTYLYKNMRQCKTCRVEHDHARQPRRRSQ